MFKNITRGVWILSIISLLNDISSEMLYPVIPLYLKQIGYGTLLIGILEGIAECISGMTKIYVGSVSDTFQRRTPFIQWGYFLSMLSRPIIGLSSFVGLIFLGRSMDKIGKGIRTSSRDALLADESTLQTRAEVFGFHRSMDTIGAVVGPLIAIIFLHFYPGNYQAIFLITILPGLFVLLFTFQLKDKNTERVLSQKVSLKEHFSYYREAPKSYLSFLYIMLIFTFVNSSDIFLLLKAKESGMSESGVLTLYMCFNLVFALFAFPVGKLADRFGKIQMLIIGLCVYGISYLAFAFTSNSWVIVGAFIFYGLFYAFTQGIIKVLFSEKVDAHKKSSAIGLYDGLNSFCLLIANAVAGFVWYRFGSAYMLTYSGGISLLIAIYFLCLYPKKNPAI